MARVTDGAPEGARPDLGEVLASLRAGEYAGWILVEQDVLPRSVAAYELARVHQINNRQYLRDRGW